MTNFDLDNLSYLPDLILIGLVHRQTIDPPYPVGSINLLKAMHVNNGELCSGQMHAVASCLITNCMHNYGYVVLLHEYTLVRHDFSIVSQSRFMDLVTPCSFSVNHHIHVDLLYCL